MTDRAMPFPQRATWALVVAAATLAGCASTTPTFDANFGEGVRRLMAQQVRHPDATEANRHRDADGIDGRTARETMERYVRGSVEPARTAPSFQLGTGGEQGPGR
jgi:hypothetical protein